MMCYSGQVAWIGAADVVLGWWSRFYDFSRCGPSRLEQPQTVALSNESEQTLTRGLVDCLLYDLDGRDQRFGLTEAHMCRSGNQ